MLRGAESAARAAAAARGIPVVELAPEADGAAGLFTLHPAQALKGKPARPGMAEADDVALVLHTSGTTSRPKIVPLRHVNVTASAYHIGRTLALAPDDVCLNIMPLFHIHGLIAAVAVEPGRRRLGGAARPGFNAFRFFAWFAAVRPTWYTAVPTMHQAILGLRRRATGTAIAAGRLRLHPLLVLLAAAAGDGRRWRRPSACR